MHNFNDVILISDVIFTSDVITPLQFFSAILEIGKINIFEFKNDRIYTKELQD